MIRDIILNRLDELGWSRYELATDPRLTAHEKTVMRYLRGDRDMTGDHLFEILQILSIDLKPRGRPQSHRQLNAGRSAR